MWEIRCIVGDKKALDALEALDGLTLEPPVIKRVHVHSNGHAAAPVAPKISKSPPPGESSVDKLRNFVQGANSVSPSEMRMHLESKGFSKNGYSYALRVLQDEGILKRIEGSKDYEVLT